ncbi:ATP-dependent RNA helicase, partial [Rhizophlyctis rosea]
FTTPTEIQSKSLPVTLAGDHDLIGAAETGSGKTFAFGLPILQHLAARAPQKGKEDLGCTGLILAPTRELAIQVTDHLNRVAKFMRVKIVSIVGGMSEQKQKRLLSSRPDVVVATPGRLWELAREDQDVISRLRKISFLAIDEADRMLESGHFKDLDHILDAISLRRRDTDESSKKVSKRRTFIFSATLIQDGRLKMRLNKPMKFKGGAPTFDDLLKRLEFQDPKPVYIDVTSTSVMATSLVETQIECLHTDKDAFLYYILTRYPGRTLVFVNSIDAIRRLVPVLGLVGVKAYGLHAEMQQRMRLKNLDRFRDSPDAVLIASDVAARGLDIPNVEHVVHYQLPRTAELYVHRSGRTARGGGG